MCNLPLPSLQSTALAWSAVCFSVFFFPTLPKPKPKPPFPSSSSSPADFTAMSGVWVFKNGVLLRIENPGAVDTSGGGGGGCGRRKVLLHVPTSEVVTSYGMLERKLAEIGWERYPSMPDMIQFHKRSSVHLISLPSEFSRLKLVHMYDVVVKTRNVFEVRDA